MMSAQPTLPDGGWTAPKLVPLTAAAASEGGKIVSLTEGQTYTKFPVLMGYQPS
jgi:hypothetical protein